MLPVSMSIYLQIMLILARWSGMLSSAALAYFLLLLQAYKIVYFAVVSSTQFSIQDFSAASQLNAVLLDLDDSIRSHRSLACTPRHFLNWVIF